MLSHKIRIYPSKEQVDLLNRTCGVSRFAWNWALDKWNKIYELGGKPNAMQIKLLFNKEKRENPDISWMYEVTKCAPEYAIKDLGEAFSKFFKGIAKHPKFHSKKNSRTSFSIANDKFRVEEDWCVLPKVGRVRMAETLRFNGKIMKGTVSKRAGKWFLSITVDVSKDKTKNGKAIGIDLGLKTTLVLSNDLTYNQVDLKKDNRRIKREQRKLSKKVLGSRNFKKQVQRLQVAYYKADCKKTDWIEKTTSEIAKDYECVALEDLNIKGMMKNRKLSGKFQQVSLYRVVERLKTKASHVVQIHRFLPSSKVCSNCGSIKKDLKLSDRQYTCDCGLSIDRDLNAAINIVRWASSEFTLVDKQNLDVLVVSDYIKNDTVGCLEETRKLCII